jgi:aldehyde dehydrogenase (NAD+)
VRKLIVLKYTVLRLLGNTFVFKGSEKSPYSILAIARLFKEAGFPPGVVNILTGAGKTGALLAAHMDVDKISFTGSGATGRKVVDAANKSNMKRVTLELGGKSPSLVFEDANFDTAIQAYASSSVTYIPY